MMIHFDLRCPDDAPPSLLHSDAEIDVVVGDCKVFVKAVQFLEQSTAHHHARCRNTGEILLESGATKIAAATFRHAHERVPCDPANAKNNPGMLNGGVRVIQHRANCSDAFEVKSR